MSTDNAPSLQHPDAVAAPSGRTAWHFGDPLAEQRRAARGCAVLDRSDRAVVQITGAERLSWLEGFVSQHIAALAAGEGAESLILDANGRVEHHFGVCTTTDTVFLDTAAGRAAELHAFLDKMVFWADAEPVLAPELAVLTVVGPRTAEALAPLLDDVQGETLPGLRAHRPFSRPGGGGIDLLVDRAELDTAWSALLAATDGPLGSWGWDALRVADLVPGVEDVDAKSIPHEVPGWIGDAASGGAVHLDKGCYRGQETVARVHNLGKAPRRLVRVMFDGTVDELPAPGTELRAGGRAVGRLGTAVHHFEEGPVALALVKRSIGPDVNLSAGEATVTIDPESLTEDNAPQAGREAVARLRGLD